MADGLNDLNSQSKVVQKAIEIVKKAAGEIPVEVMQNLDEFEVELRSFFFEQTRDLKQEHLMQMIAIHNEIVSAVRGRPLTDGFGQEISLGR